MLSPGRFRGRPCVRPGRERRCRRRTSRRPPSQRPRATRSPSAAGSADAKRVRRPHLASPRSRRAALVARCAAPANREAVRCSSQQSGEGLETQGVEVSGACSEQDVPAAGGRGRSKSDDLGQPPANDLGREVFLATSQSPVSHHAPTCRIAGINTSSRAAASPSSARASSSTDRIASGSSRFDASSTSWTRARLGFSSSRIPRTHRAASAAGDRSRSRRASGAAGGALPCGTDGAHRRCAS